MKLLTLFFAISAVFTFPLYGFNPGGVTEKIVLSKCYIENLFYPGGITFSYVSAYPPSPRFYDLYKADYTYKYFVQKQVLLSHYDYYGQLVFQKEFIETIAESQNYSSIKTFVVSNQKPEKIAESLEKELPLAVKELEPRVQADINSRHSQKCPIENKLDLFRD